MTNETSSQLFPYENPPPEVIKKLEEDIGMTEESLKEDIKTLKEWMVKQPHLPNIDDEKVLKRFLYYCKNSLEKTKMKLDNYYSVRGSSPEYFNNRDPLDPELVESINTMFFCGLPKLTPEHDRVCIFKIFDTDVSKYNPTLLFKSGLMALDCHVSEERCRSHILIYDMQGGSIGHVASLTIPIIKKFFSSGLVGMPQRYSGFHIVNAPSIAESLISMAKSFLKDKLSKRTYVHHDMTSLHKFIPKEILPAEYGGTFPMTMNELKENTYAGLVAHREWFKQQENLVTDEKKRLSKFNSLDQIEGSFRKINID
ncbi:alpha-tocopherol transfer protein-like [Lycorma delicatula]|uniref:alpha-tocopherol transfer protein-like n=1 Tax=Lycorma delicatula TaxID=130591 RepID=UPI003F517313